MTVCAGDKQKNLRALYNIPPPRLFPPSPYPLFTIHQLAMRRKVEILKYSNNEGAGTTKSQKWSGLVRTQSMSQYAINNPTSSSATCPADELIPTSTTRCDVPGPAEYLYYDPAVPLYQYATQERAFATEPAPPYIWRPITQNVVETITASTYDMYVDDTTLASYTVSCPAGVLTVSNTIDVTATITFTFGISLAAWLVGVYTGSNAVQPSDVPFSLTITGIKYFVQYNDATLVSGDVPMSAWTTFPVTFGPAQIPRPSGQFYGIQYVGTPVVSNISIPNVQPDNIYQVLLDVTYTYPHGSGSNVVDRMDAFQTGVFANIDAAHVSATTPNFTLTSSVPSSSFVPSSFIDYRTTLPLMTMKMT